MSNKDINHNNYNIQQSTQNVLNAVNVYSVLPCFNKEYIDLMNLSINKVLMSDLCDLVGMQPNELIDSIESIDSVVVSSMQSKYPDFNFSADNGAKIKNYLINNYKVVNLAADDINSMSALVVNVGNSLSSITNGKVGYAASKNLINGTANGGILPIHDLGAILRDNIFPSYNADADKKLYSEISLSESEYYL